MDGGSNNDDLRGGTAGAQARPAFESIQEFQVVTNQFDAEYGAATAGVVNAVTKQGSNVYHGSAFGYFTNPAMTAKDFFVEQANAEKPDTRKQQWGGTIGGPIIRDKMHYFFSFERQDRDEGRSRVYPTRPDKSFTVAQETNSWNYLWRADHQLNSNHNYSVRFLWDHQPNYNQVLGNGTLDTLSIEKDNDYTFVTSYNWVIAPTKLNTMRASLTHEKPKRGQELYQETGDWTLAPPTLQYLNFIDQADTNYADFRDMNIYAFDDTFSWFIPGARGSHDVKIGAQYQLGEHYREDQRFMNGQFTFIVRRGLQRGRSQDVSGATDRPRAADGPAALEDALDRHLSPGQVADDPAPDGEPRAALRRPHLSDHRGLEPVLHRPERLPRRQEQHPAAYRSRVQPEPDVRDSRRLRHVLREAVDRSVRELLAQPRVLELVHGPVSRQRRPDPGPSRGQFPTDPFLVNGPVLNRDAARSAGARRARSPGTPAPSGSTRRIAFFPSQQQGSIGYERQIGRSLSVAADFMHIQNRDQPLRYNLNPAIKLTTGRTAPVTRVDIQNVAGQLGVTPFSSDVWIVEYIGETRYDGLTMQIEKRFADNWGARFSYGLGYGRGNTNGTPTATNDFQVLAERNLDLNEGPTNVDRRHNATHQRPRGSALGDAA